MEVQLSTKNVLNILTADCTNSSRVMLFELERESKLPLAKRKTTGKVERRYWSLNDLPKIAKYFGYLDKPKKQIVISTYAPKGGVLKTTFTFNLARALAVNGIKTIIVGLDSQSSITSLCDQSEQITDLSELVNEKKIGIYDFLETRTYKLKDLIKKTDLEFLDYIPENDDLDRLSLALGTKPRGEYLIKEKLLVELKNYDVVLFDNPPSYSTLSISSIIACDVLITPLGCELEAFKALHSTIEKLSAGIKDYALTDLKHIFLATKLDNTTISKQIFYDYQNNFKGLVLADAVKTTVAGQEASFHKKSIIEYKTDSPLALDYHKIIKELWLRIVK